MSDRKKRAYAKQAIRNYVPVEVGSESEAREVAKAIDDRGFFGVTFEIDGTWFAQAT